MKIFAPRRLRTLLRFPMPMGDGRLSSNFLLPFGSFGRRQRTNVVLTAAAEAATSACEVAYERIAEIGDDGRLRTRILAQRPGTLMKAKIPNRSSAAHTEDATSSQAGDLDDVAVAGPIGVQGQPSLEEWHHLREASSMSWKDPVYRTI